MNHQTCPRCAPFSPEVLALYRKLQAAQDPDERGEILLQLAHRFAEDYDSSDEGFTESFHSVMDTYHQAFLTYNQAGLRLGRVLTHVLENHVKNTDDEDAIEEVDTSLPTTLKADPSIN